MIQLKSNSRLRRESLDFFRRDAREVAIQPVCDAERADDALPNFEGSRSYRRVFGLRVCGKSVHISLEMKMLRSQDRVVDEDIDGPKSLGGPPAERQVGDRLERDERPIVDEVGVVQARQRCFGEVVRALLKCD